MEEQSDAFPAARYKMPLQKKLDGCPCPQVGTKDVGWCATCVAGAKSGQAGYCDPKNEEINVSHQIYGAITLTLIFVQVYDYEYDDKDPEEESVLHDRAWGFCDPKCFSQKGDIIAMDLQEVPFASKSMTGGNLKVDLWILSEEECRNRTWTHSQAKFRAMVDR